MIQKPLMWMLAGGLSAALGACAATPAPSSTAAAPAPAAAAAPVQTASNGQQPPAPAHHKTCQTDYQVGSHISSNTVCLSDDEEERLHEQEEEQLDVMKNTSGFGPGSSH